MVLGKQYLKINSRFFHQSRQIYFREIKACIEKKRNFESKILEWVRPS